VISCRFYEPSVLQSVKSGRGLNFTLLNNVDFHLARVWRRRDGWRAATAASKTVNIVWAVPLLAQSSGCKAGIYHYLGINIHSCTFGMLCVTRLCFRNRLINQMDDSPSCLISSKWTANTTTILRRKRREYSQPHHQVSRLLCQHHRHEPRCSDLTTIF